jgi:MSHA biogenesis protein MshK
MKHHCTLATTLLALFHLTVTQGADLADPTRPASMPAVTLPTLATSSAVTGKLKLEAVVHSNQRQLAIVNGKLLRVGESLGDVRIEAISNDAVRYSQAGRSHTLRLAEQAIQVRRATAGHEAK